MKWVLDLFFLRSRVFGLERSVIQRDREIADLRHEHGRVLTDLKNRLTELDATQKSKTVVTTTLSAREADLAAARADASRVAAELAAATRRLDGFDRDLAAANSTHDALQAAVLSRDSDLAAAKSAGDETIAKLGELSESLDRARREGEAAAKSRKALEKELAETKAAAKQAAIDVAAANDAFAKARDEADAAGKSRKALEEESLAAKSARAAADGTVKKRELAISELERKSAELQSAFDDAAGENGKIAKELAGVRLELAEARAAVARLEKAASKPAVAAADPAQFARIASLEGELSGARESRISLEAELGAVSESHARLEQELGAARERATALEARLEAQPEELAEVRRDIVETTLLADLDQLTRERNELAAELAALRASGATLQPPTKPEPKAARSKPAPVEEFVAACPQHLSDVKGIGASFETRLYAAGIGSYWDLSRLTDKELVVILELDDVQARQLDANAIRADAARLATETKSVGRRWNQDPPDDLEPIEGIGPAFEKKLYDAGICTYAALGSSSVGELERICPAGASRRPDYASWIEQARRLSAEREG